MANYVVSLASFVPGTRYDGKVWTQAKIEQSATLGGAYTVIDTQSIATYPEPENPPTLNLTTTKATLEQGWYRITFEDAEKNLQVSAAIYSSAQGASSLCGIADVKFLLQKKETDKSQDTMIEWLIPRASKSVSLYCEREFAPASSNLTRTFEYYWENKMCSLAPYDLRSLTKIVMDTDRSPTPGIELSTQEYRLWPQPPRDGTYTSIRLFPFGVVLGRVMWPTRQFQITGSWGFPSIPADVVHATALTVVHWLTVNTAAFRRPDDDPNIQHVPKRGIPPEAWDLLNRYKRAASA